MLVSPGCVTRLISQGGKEARKRGLDDKIEGLNVFPQGLHTLKRLSIGYHTNYFVFSTLVCHRYA